MFSIGNSMVSSAIWEKDARVSFSRMTLKMTTAMVVETSVNHNNNSPSQDSTNPDDLHLQTRKNIHSWS